MIAIALAITLLAADAEPPARDELGFARSLYDEGDYYRAITEAKRFVYEHPDDARSGEAKLLIGRCYLAGEQWKAAIAALEPLVARAPAGAVAADASFALADARLGAKEWDVAAIEYARFRDDHADDPRAAIADLRIGWSRLFAADELMRLDAARGRAGFRAAAAELSRLPPEHPEAARVAELAEGARALAALPRRSPALAGTMSAVLPGAGQIYAGRARDGIIALIVNGLFIAGAVEAYHRENYVACGVLALFELGWYTGNVYSAVNSAHRFNDERRAAKMLELKKKWWVGATPMRDGGLAAAGGSF